MQQIRLFFHLNVVMQQAFYLKVLILNVKLTFKMYYVIFHLLLYIIILRQLCNYRCKENVPSSVWSIFFYQWAYLKPEVGGRFLDTALVYVLPELCPSVPHTHREADILAAHTNTRKESAPSRRPVRGHRLSILFLIYFCPRLQTGRHCYVPTNFYLTQHQTRLRLARASLRLKW